MIMGGHTMGLDGPPPSAKIENPFDSLFDEFVFVGVLAVGVVLAFFGHKFRKPIDFLLGLTLTFFMLQFFKVPLLGLFGIQMRPDAVAPDSINDIANQGKAVVNEIVDDAKRVVEDRNNFVRKRDYAKDILENPRHHIDVIVHLSIIFLSIVVGIIAVSCKKFGKFIMGAAGGFLFLNMIRIQQFLHFIPEPQHQEWAALGVVVTGSALSGWLLMSIFPSAYALVMAFVGSTMIACAFGELMVDLGQFMKFKTDWFPQENYWEFYTEWFPMKMNLPLSMVRGVWSFGAIASKVNTLASKGTDAWIKKLTDGYDWSIKGYYVILALYGVVLLWSLYIQCKHMKDDEDEEDLESDAEDDAETKQKKKEKREAVERYMWAEEGNAGEFSSMIKRRRDSSDADSDSD